MTNYLEIPAGDEQLLDEPVEHRPSALQSFVCDALDYKQCVDGLRRSNARLLHALKFLVAARDEQEKSGETERYRVLNERGWTEARAILADADNGALSPPPTRSITVELDGGLVQDVTGIPEGYEVRVEDYDGPDDTDPSWDAGKGCAVTVHGRKIPSLQPDVGKQDVALLKQQGIFVSWFGHWQRSLSKTAAIEDPAQMLWHVSRQGFLQGYLLGAAKRDGEVA